MYERIKALADEAIALQNKARMEEVLREISGICANVVMTDASPCALTPNPVVGPMTAEQFEAAETAQHKAERGQSYADNLKESMQATVREVETSAAIVTGAATPLTRKQRASKK